MSRRYIDLSRYSANGGMTTFMDVGGALTLFELAFDTSATVVIPAIPVLLENPTSVTGTLGANNRILGTFDLGYARTVAGRPQVLTTNAPIYVCTNHAGCNLPTSVLGLMPSQSSTSMCPEFKSIEAPTNGSSIASGTLSVMELFGQLPGITPSQKFAVYLPSPTAPNQSGFLDLAPYDCATSTDVIDHFTTTANATYCGWSMLLDQTSPGMAVRVGNGVSDGINTAYIDFTLSHDGFSAHTSQVQALIQRLTAAWQPEQVKLAMDGQPFPCVLKNQLESITFSLVSVIPAPSPQSSALAWIRLTPDMYAPQVSGYSSDMCKFVLYGDNRSDPSWTFGTSFFQHHYVSFDRANLRVSYVPATSPSYSRCINQYNPLPTYPPPSSPGETSMDKHTKSWLIGGLIISAVVLIVIIAMIYQNCRDRKKLFLRRLNDAGQDLHHQQVQLQRYGGDQAGHGNGNMSTNQPPLQDELLEARQLAWQNKQWNQERAMADIRASAGILPNTASSGLPTRHTTESTFAEQASMERDLSLIRHSSDAGLGQQRQQQQSPLPGKARLEHEMELVRHSSGVDMGWRQHQLSPSSSLSRPARRESSQPQVFTHAISATSILTFKPPLEQEMDRIRAASGANL